jgi:ribosomal protein S12 methylthiotransferase
MSGLAHADPTTTDPHPSATNRADPAQKNNINTISFVSLGCPKNLVDSEKMLGLLAQDGLIPVPDGQPADATVINTCGFLEASKDESMQEIQRAADLKKQGKLKRLIVAGCLVQRHRAKLLEWCPDIDALIGVFDRDKISQAVLGDRPAQKDASIDLPFYSSIAANATLAKQARGIKHEGYYEDDGARLRLTPRHYAYIRMSEGCNQNCTFCTIPSIRGKMRSKPIDAFLKEARELFADGTFELNIIGQDTTSYGQDTGYDAQGQGLVGLLTKLNNVASEHGDAWLRLMYAYPSKFTDQMIDAIAGLPNVVKYIDMPLQHINDRVLNKMRRHTSRKLIETLLGKLRDRVPGIALRTTFITGFPSETDAEHKELVNFIRDFRFDNLGVFPYSPEPGTPAGTLHENQAIPDDVIQHRFDELMQTQQEVVFNRNAELSEQQPEIDVLIDAATDSVIKPPPGSAPGVTTDTGGCRLFQGRTYAQAPQVDGLTYVQSQNDLTPGELIRCKIIAYNDYDLIAVPTDELNKTTPLTILR